MWGIIPSPVWPGLLAFFHGLGGWGEIAKGLIAIAIVTVFMRKKLFHGPAFTEQIHSLVGEKNCTNITKVPIPL